MNTGLACSELQSIYLAAFLFPLPLLDQEQTGQHVNASWQVTQFDISSFFVVSVFLLSAHIVSQYWHGILVSIGGIWV